MADESDCGPFERAHREMAGRGHYAWSVTNNAQGRYLMAAVLNRLRYGDMPDEELVRQCEAWIESTAGD